MCRMVLPQTVHLVSTAVRNFAAIPICQWMLVAASMQSISDLHVSAAAELVQPRQ